MLRISNYLRLSHKSAKVNLIYKKLTTKKTTFNGFSEFVPRDFYLYETAELDANETERGDSLQQLRISEHAVTEAGLEEVIVPFQHFINVVHLKLIRKTHS